MKIGSVKTEKLLKALYKLGFRPVRQRGSHLILKDQVGRMMVVPMYKEIKPRLVRVIISELGITREKFLELLEDP
jgi:predicted RNA binding protein YcfA (HicA-like mRNA interferase family)